MKAIIRLIAARPEIEDVAASELFDEVSCLEGVTAEAWSDASDGRRPRSGFLDFLVTVVTSATALKLVDVLRAHVTRREVEIEIKRPDGATMKIAARGDGTGDAVEIVAFLTQQGTKPALGGDYAEEVVPHDVDRQLDAPTADGDDQS